MLMAAIRPSSTPPKGRPPLRKCPDDFDVIFIEQGRVGCEAWYRARRDTINRWLGDRGKQRLIDARAAFVAHQRANGQWITRSTRLVEVRLTGQTPRLQAIRDRRKINPVVARHAAQFLRISRHGGFVISQAQNGDWWVGSRRLSAAQLVDFAVGRGFDVKEAEKSEMVQPDGSAGGGKFNRPDFTAEERETYTKDAREKLLYESSNVERRLGRLTDGE